MLNIGDRTYIVVSLDIVHTKSAVLGDSHFLPYVIIRPRQGASLTVSTLSKIIYIYIYIRGSLNKVQDFFRMGTFIDSTHMKL